jgi:hypothetical protein
MVERESSATIEQVRARREQLGEAADRLEREVTRPAGEREVWRADVASALAQVSATLAAHVAEVEAPGGLYDEVMERSPRLAHQIQRLRREHVELLDDVAHLDALLEVHDLSVEAVRDRSLQLLLAVSRHRHRGADLIWDSYDLDIGTSE